MGHIFAGPLIETVFKEYFCSDKEIKDQTLT